MAANVDSIRQMADQATTGLTAQVRDWSRFLIMAGQFYKYNFLDQVLIYTQRPQATACAEYDLWKNKMGRYVRRGSRGIALIRRGRGDRFALRYVFDVADTERRENARDPRPWQYRSEYQAAITAHLAESFGAIGDGGLDKQLVTLAVRFSDAHWHDFKDHIMLSLQDSGLDELDEDNVALHFCNAVTVSLSFLLLSRCGFDLDSYFTPEDFACIGEFNTRDTVLALGNAVSESANVILRQVERAIRLYERGKATGDLPPAHPPIDTATAAGQEPAAVPHLQPESDTPAAPEAAPAAVPTPPEEPAPAPAASAQQETSSVDAPEQMELFALPRPAPQPMPTTARPAKPAAEICNFRITDDCLGVGGPKAKYAANVAAIRTLKQLEAEGRSASPDEQEILSRYVGWGGVPDAFEPDKPEWAREYAELKSLLSEDEYASARASVLNSHYTSPNQPEEEYYDGNNYVAYVDQYAHRDIYVNHKNPVGYFERYTEDGYSGGLEIVGSEDENYMTFNFYLDPGQTGYYGNSWVEPDFSITTHWLKSFSSHIYAIKLNENTYLNIGLYGTFALVTVDNYYRDDDILLESATTDYSATIMSNDEIAGTYYCVYQEEYVGE